MAIQHCDGRRKRRNSPVRGRRMWYSYSRGVRFKRRLSIVEVNIGPPSLDISTTVVIADTANITNTLMIHGGGAAPLWVGGGSDPTPACGGV
jgi:hypothetical protein